MCGICGVVQLEGTPRPVIGQEVLARMTESLEHRGPDDFGYHVADGVAIGARRLSIVDVEGGHQPFSNEAGDVWAAQNGEIYNHAEIRRRLERGGHRFRSRCDTEVLPHLYEDAGDALPRHLRGMIAAVVWDARRRRALLVRDRMGIKPLYVARVGDLLVFGSELKSLLASGLVAPELDFDSVDAYLTLGYVPGPATILAGVSKLPPGSQLAAGIDEFELTRYWRYPEPQPAEVASEDELGNRLLEQLDESVKLRLMSDVPLGAMLSGGLDSTLIVALMAKHMSEPVKTFSVGFSDAGSTSELGPAREIARAFGTDHHEIEFSHAEAAVDLDDLVWHLDEPVASLSALGFYALSKLAAQHVTVALSGQGADELLGGYRKHVAVSLAGRLDALPSIVGSGVRAAARGTGRLDARIGGVLAAGDPVERLLASSGRLRPELRHALYRGPLAGAGGAAAANAIRARLGGVVGHLPAGLHLDAQLALVDDMLHYFDRTSMAHSLEVRVPFLDHELVELCATIPHDLKVRGLTSKYLLRRVARGIVPEHVIKRKKVGFFHRSIDGWVKNAIDEPMGDYLTAANPRFGEFLEPGAVRDLVAAHRAGRGRSGELLLAIMFLEMWLRDFVPRAVGSAGSPSRRAA